MKTFLATVAVCLCSVSSQGQTLPPDINPVTLSRMPPVTKSELVREHKVSSELWARQIQAFGRQNTIEIMQLMGDYFMAGMMMNAADQHLPPTRQPLMPALTRGR